MSSVHIPCFSPDKLISGGGDLALKIWDWMTGKVQAEVEVWSIVQSFIKVEGGKRGRGWGEEAERGKQRKRRGKAKNSESEEDVEELVGKVGPSAGDITPEQRQLNVAESGEIVQVVHKIDSLDLGTSKYILFSAVGSVFVHLFSFCFPMLLTPNAAARPRYLSSPSLL